MKRRQAKISRILQVEPKPDEDETEIMYLLSEGETPEDIKVKYAAPTRHAVSQRLYRMRQLFDVTTNAEMVGKALRKGWIT